MDPVPGLRAYRRRYVGRMTVLRVVLAPLIWLLRAAMAVARATGSETSVFGAVFRRISERIVHRRRHCFDGYSPKATDVFVVSDIKSGTNWTLQMAYQLINEGQGEFEHVHDVVAWPDSRVQRLPIQLDHEYPSTMSKTGRRVIKTHVQADWVPYHPHAAYICVVRDPKDMLVSSYFFIRSAIFGPLMPSPATWFKLFLDDRHLHGRWAHFAAAAWSWRDRPNVLFLRFEEMKTDPEGTLRRIVELLGVELTEEQLASALHRSSFGYMKAIDHKFYPGRITPTSLAQGSMIRSGKAGNSAEMLTKEQQGAIDEHFASELQRAGSDYPFAEFYGPINGS